MAICCSLLTSCVSMKVSGQTFCEALVFRNVRYWCQPNLVKKEKSSPAVNFILLFALGVSHKNLLRSLPKDIQTHFSPTWHHLQCGWSLHADKYCMSGCWSQQALLMINYKNALTLVADRNDNALARLASFWTPKDVPVLVLPSGFNTSQE